MGNALALREYYNNLDNEILYEAPIATNIINNQENTTTNVGFPINVEISTNVNNFIGELSDLIKEF